MPEISEETGWGDGVYGAGEPYTPPAPVYAGHGTGSVSITLGSGDNSDVVTYAIRAIAGDFVGYVQSNGAILENPVAVNGNTYSMFEPAGASDSALYDSANGFLTAGFAVGMNITVSTASGYSGGTIKQVSAGTIVFDGAVRLPYSEAGEAVTITQDADLEHFQTLSAWGSPLAVTGLDDLVGYTFAAQAQGQDGMHSEWSAESSAMYTFPALDSGVYQETPAEREVTTGNVRVGSAGITISGTQIPEVDDVEYSGVILAEFRAQGYGGETASAEVEFSKDSGSSWATATRKAEQGDDPSGLSTSSLIGDSHVFAWDSEADTGASDYKATIKLRIRLRDSSENYSAWIESGLFTIRNLPGELIFQSGDGREWGSAENPYYVADMPTLRVGNVGFPEIVLYDSISGSTPISGYPKQSADAVDGWGYQDAGGGWHPMLPTGIPSDAVTIKYQVQESLEAGKTYYARGRMSEPRERS